VSGVNTYLASFEANGIPVSMDMVIGGHEWYTWPRLLYNFLTKVAFQHGGIP
jgi:enterochelin esterase-like enzyme